MVIPNFVEMTTVRAVLIFLLLKSKDVISSIATSHYSMNINMPDVRPHVDDAYLCTAKKLNPVESYIVQYEPDADGRTAHHMLLFGCQGLHSQSHLYPGHWSCGSELCSQMTIMYGWAKNAPAMKLPPKVGFLVGGNSSIHYLVLQVHYSKALPDGSTDNTGLKLHMTTERQPFITGIHLLMADAGQIPPYRPKYSIDLNCKYKSNVPIHVFAYRVHTHKLGTVVSGYKYNLINDTWTTLAKGNPQWPQAFYPITHQVRVTSSDILAARCTYNSTAVNMPVVIGSASSNEMCNLYLMYYTEYQNRVLDPVAPCVGVEYFKLIRVLPVGSDIPLPANKVLEHSAHGFGNHGSAITYEGVESDDLHTSSLSAVNSLHTSNDNSVHSMHTPAGQYSHMASHLSSEFKYQGVHGWPSKTLKLGQISAVSIDRKGNPVIFHRGNHVWDALSFDYYNNYIQSRDHAIAVPTVITLDPISGAALEQWGENMFFMPHGLTIGKDGRYWITDVGLHQVFCFSADEKHESVMTLGARFDPGSDQNHFCKPTSTAISSNGEIYVADGYCNSRIMRFSSRGEFISQFGKPDSLFDKRPPVGTFRIPHKVVLLEDKDLICVADRENGRIQCFAITTGDFRFKIEQEEFGGTVYSISYAKDKSLLFAISGEAVYKDHLVKAFVFNITGQQLLTTFPLKSGTFTRPHDIAVSDDGEEAYVCEIGPNVVWKFLREYHKSTKKVLETPEVEVEHVHSSSPPHVGHVQVLDSISDGKTNDALNDIDDDINGFETSMIIMALLGIPVLVLILITVAMRLRKRGSLQMCSFGHLKGWLGGYRTPHPQKKFDLGNFLNPHKGFDKLSVEESDGEDDGSGSDIEEFNATTNKA